MRCKLKSIILVWLVVILGFVSPMAGNIPVEPFSKGIAVATTTYAKSKINPSTIKKYNGKAYIAVHGNKPYFSKKEKKKKTAFETYSKLDSLGRCGVAYANICEDIMPTGERGQIGSIKPSGWKMAKYNGYVEGNYLYNRSHLIGYALAGENANKKNLITGTRYMNCDGMLPLEEKVVKYVEKTDHHVLYRVTPVFEGKNLVASGVLMEAYSVEDKGKGIQFCVYCYNVQPGIQIDYKNGNSSLIADYKGEYATTSYYATHKERIYHLNRRSDSDLVASKDTQSKNDTSKQQVASAPQSSSSANYVVNINTKVIHRLDCASVKRMSEKNKLYSDQSVSVLEKEGYRPCQNCNP